MARSQVSRRDAMPESQEPRGGPPARAASLARRAAALLLRAALLLSLAAVLALLALATGRDAALQRCDGPCAPDGWEARAIQLLVAPFDVPPPAEASQAWTRLQQSDRLRELAAGVATAGLLLAVFAPGAGERVGGATAGARAADASTRSNGVA